MDKDLMQKPEDFNETGEGTKVLCGASAYEKKFYLNEEFNSLPERVKQELQIMCVLFTEDVGGVLLLEFDEARQTAPPPVQLPHTHLYTHTKEKAGAHSPKLMFTQQKCE